jgi:hypothetical protein
VWCWPAHGWMIEEWMNKVVSPPFSPLPRHILGPCYTCFGHTMGAKGYVTCYLSASFFIGKKSPKRKGKNCLCEAHWRYFSFKLQYCHISMMLWSRFVTLHLKP